MLLSDQSETGWAAVLGEYYFDSVNCKMLLFFSFGVWLCEAPSVESLQSLFCCRTLIYYLILSSKVLFGVAWET